MADAFIDESISTTDKNYFLVVAVVLTTNRRELELITRRIKKVRQLKAHSELRASVTPPNLIQKFLTALARDPAVSIVAAMWSSPKGEIGNHDELYRQLMARCALATVKQEKHIDLYLDKRYTNRQQQRELEAEIRESLAVVSGNVVRIFQEDSQVIKELAAADFVAWAMMQHYGRGNSEFYNIIRAKNCPLR